MSSFASPHGVHSGSNVAAGSNSGTKNRMTADFSDDENDIEFDETPINTPKSFSARSVNNAFRTHETVSKLPLKGSPSAEKRPSKFKARNGTPLRPAPARPHAATGPERVGLDEEDTLIRSSRLISDDNKFSPGHTSVTAFKNSRPADPTSPTRHSRVSPQDVKSSPLNSRVRPVSFGDAAKTLFKRKNNGLFRERSAQPGPEEMDFEPSISSDGRLSPIIPKEVSFDVEETSSKKAISHKVYANGIPRSVPSKGRKLPPTTASNHYNVASSVEVDSISTNGVEKGSLQVGNPSRVEIEPELPRSEILDRINATIESLRQREHDSKGLTFDEEVNDIDLESDISSDETPAELLNELDSFLPKSSKKSQTKDPLNFGVGSSISPIRKHYNRLSDRYARHIMNKRAEADPTPAAEEQPWPTRKWLKLNKLVLANTVGIQDILNSEVVMEKLGCRSQEELKQRVEFLIKFNAVNKPRMPSNRLNKLA